MIESDSRANPPPPPITAPAAHTQYLEAEHEKLQQYVALMASARDILTRLSPPISTQPHLEAETLARAQSARVGQQLHDAMQDFKAILRRGER